MRYIDRKRIWCVVIAIFYAFYVVNEYIPFSYYNMFAGVEYKGYVIYYAVTILLFGMFIFIGFGDAENYISGYGILEMTRSKKRSTIIGKIVMHQIKNVLVMLASVVFSYVIQAHILNKEEHIDVSCILVCIGLFGVVCFSLMLWQSILEVLCDSRIAIIGVLSIISIHLYVGDILFAGSGNKYLNLIFYSNLALGARREALDIHEGLMFLTVGVVCMIQILLLNIVFKRKDIFSAKE